MPCSCLTQKGKPCKNPSKGETKCAIHLKLGCISNKTHVISQSVPSHRSSKKKSYKKKSNYVKSKSPRTASMFSRMSADEELDSKEYVSRSKKPISPPIISPRTGSMFSRWVVDEALEIREHDSRSRKSTSRAQTTSKSEKKDVTKEEESALHTRPLQPFLPLSLSNHTTVPSKTGKIRSESTHREYDKALKLMKSWYEIIEPSVYRFPHWTIELFRDSKNLFDSIMSKVRVYVVQNQMKNLQQVVDLITQREPVNITRVQHYNKYRLKRDFGWEDGYYDRYYNQYKKLAPNIAVYTPSYFIEPGSKTNKTPKFLHILHVIGYALDHKMQSDYRFLKSNTVQKRDGGEETFLRYFYYDVFKLIFQCAMDLKLRVIVLPPFGVGHFAKLYKGGNMLELWIDGLVEAVSRYQKIFNFAIQFMGFSEVHSLRVTNRLIHAVKFSRFQQSLGYFPGCLKDISDLNQSLIINAWDSLSAPGNGSGGDSSLDGAIGASTTSAIVGNGALNPFITVDSVVQVL